MSSKKKNDLNNNTKDNPYDNYHGHQNSSGQNLDNSTKNKDSKNSTGKDSKNRNKNK
jgi:hypothetical protein